MQKDTNKMMNVSQYLLGNLSKGFLFVILLSMQSVTLAENDAYPNFNGEFKLKLKLRDTYDSDDPNGEYSSIVTKMSFTSSYAFGNNFSIDSDIIFESLSSNPQKDDLFFDDMGLYVEVLKLNYEYENGGIFVGKYNVDFGDAPGYPAIWASTMADRYELTGRIGVGASYVYGDDTSEYTLATSTFFLDTSFLSEAAFVSEADGGRQTKKRDGGVGNTEDFSSYSLSMRGVHDMNDSTAFFGVGFVHQAEGDAEVNGVAEKSYFLNFGFETPINDRVTVDTLIEIANIEDSGGLADNKEQYRSIFATARLDSNWRVIVGYTKHDVNSANTGYDEDAYQISSRYDFDSGIGIEGGWLYRSNSNTQVDTKSIGANVFYKHKF